MRIVRGGRAGDVGSSTAPGEVKKKKKKKAPSSFERAHPTRRRPPQRRPRLDVGSAVVELRASSVLGVARLPDGRVDGVAYCRRVIAEIKRLKKLYPSQRIAVVFDLDNTLFETRTRTLAVLKAFDEAHDTKHFAKLSMDQIGWDGQETCVNMKRPELAELVAPFWEEHFWSGAHFLDDMLCVAMAELANEAKQVGAEVYYLSGRIEALREATMTQIQGGRLPRASEANLILKAEMSVHTSTFKADFLLELEAKGVLIGWMATDSAKEIEEIVKHEKVKQRESNLPLVHVHHPLVRPGSLHPETPAIGDPLARLRALKRTVRKPKRLKA